jgi:S-disulfanyl-L-cysteine oxidoreductase SoxD
MRWATYLVFAAATLTMCGCKVSAPNSVESRIVVFTKHHITVGNKSEKNPMAANAENLAAGKEAFGHYCVACHGMDGQNTGVPFADRMSPPLPPLISPDVQTYTDGQLKWVIDNGISPSGMPASKGTLSDDEIWSIVLYLRHLPPAGSVGEPEMYSH